MNEQFSHAVKRAIRLSPLGPLLVRIYRGRRGNAALVLGRREGWDAAAKRVLSDGGRGLLADAALHDSLRSAINTDIDAELLWTAVRKALLLGGEDPGRRPELGELLVSLVGQCINNEYVWYVSDEERAVLGRRWKNPEGGGSTAPSWGELAVRAMFERIERLLPA
ncbi:MAG: hypothetical protein AB1558_00290, partial [Thermodesulfobacteriota bacterium]